MVVSGLVLYLSDESSSANAALDILRDRESLELGTAHDPRRVPAVLEAATDRASKDAIRELEALDGVQRVEVAFVALDDTPPATRDEIRESKE